MDEENLNQETLSVKLEESAEIDEMTQKAYKIFVSCTNDILLAKGEKPYSKAKMQGSFQKNLEKFKDKNPGVITEVNLSNFIASLKREKDRKMSNIRQSRPATEAKQAITTYLGDTGGDLRKGERGIQSAMDNAAAMTNMIVSDEISKKLDAARQASSSQEIGAINATDSLLTTAKSMKEFGALVADAIAKLNDDDRYDPAKAGTYYAGVIKALNSQMDIVRKSDLPDYEKQNILNQIGNAITQLGQHVGNVENIMRFSKEQDDLSILIAKYDAYLGPQKAIRGTSVDKV